VISRILLTIIAVSLLCTSVPAGEAGAHERVAVILSLSEAPFREVVAGLKARIEREGFAPVYDIFELDGATANAGPAFAKIRNGNYAAVITLGALATDLAVKEVPDAPLIAGLILRPDILKRARNATGVTLEFTGEQQLQWIRKMLPEAKTVGVLYSKENRNAVELADRIAATLGLEIVKQEIETPEGVPAALNRIAQRADVLWGIPDSLVLSAQLAKPILLFSFHNKIPFVGPSAPWVKAGALYALDWDYKDLGSQCGEKAIQVFNGAAPGSLPPAVPRKVLYSINVNTSKTMKIQISDQLLKGARTTY